MYPKDVTITVVATTGTIFITVPIITTTTSTADR